MQWKKLILTAALSTMALAAEATVYTETVPGEDGPMVVQVVINNGIFESLSVLGPGDLDSLDREAVKGQANLKNEPLTVDPLSGAIEPSDQLMAAIHDGIESAKKHADGEKVVFEAGTWHSCLRKADGDVEKESRSEIRAEIEAEHIEADEVCRSYRFDPLSGATEPSDELEKAIASALMRARKTVR